MKLSSAGYAHLEKAEGFRPKAYWDVKQWSIGFGTRTTNKSEVINIDEARKRLRERVTNEFEPCVNRLFKSGLTQGQFDALVSVAYNRGCAGMQTTDLFKQTKAGNKSKAAVWFTDKDTCCNVDGKYSGGVANRRRAELALYQSGANLMNRATSVIGSNRVIAIALPVVMVVVLSSLVYYIIQKWRKAGKIEQ